MVAEDAYYDTVVIDCPPYYSVSCLSAIAACDSIIIPAGIDAYSTTGMAGLVRQIDNIRQACPPDPGGRVLVTQWRRSSIGEDAVHTLREESPVPIFRTVIRRTDKVVESSWSREPVGALSPFSSASRDYRTWVAELLGRERWPAIASVWSAGPQEGATSVITGRSWTPSAGAGRPSLPSAAA